jgi:phage gpG-like protein
VINFKLQVPTFNEDWWGVSKNKIARILQEDNEESWARERDPQTGNAWAPRKQPTGGWPILRKSGRMQDKVRIRPVAFGVFATVTTSYGPYHMTGTSRMPARPWLGVPNKSMPQIETAVADAIFRGRPRRF